MLVSSEINLLPIQSSFQHTLQLQCQNSMDKTYMHEMELKITNLQKKLDKKNQLIKYLERKCGQQIIKTTKKLQDKITKLECQNSSLKYVGDSSKHFSKGNQFDKQQSTLCSQFNHTSVGTPFMEEIVRNGSYWEKLLKFSSQELREIILMQSTELQRLHNNQQNCPTPLRSSLTKDNKKMKASISKKNPLAPRRNHLKQTSNQNLNQLNVESSLKDITPSISINIPQSPSLSTSRRELTDINLVFSKQAVQTQEKSTQIQPISFNQFQIQTVQTFLTLEQNQLELIDLRIENGILRKQVQNLMAQNNNLKQQATYFQQKFKDYYKEYQSNQLILDQPSPQKPIQQQAQQQQQIFEPPTFTPSSSPSPSPYSSSTGHIIQNYRQILQIFGIQFPQPQTSEHEHDKKHQILLNQICNVKLQITQILKQYKKLERDLHDSLMRNRQYQCHIKYQEEQIGKLGEYNVQLIGLVGQLNDEVMVLRNKQINLRIFGKFRIKTGLQARVSTSQTSQAQQDQQQANKNISTSKSQQSDLTLTPLSADTGQTKPISVSS